MIGLESTNVGNREINSRLKKLAGRALLGSVLILLSTSTYVSFLFLSLPNGENVYVGNLVNANLIMCIGTSYHLWY